MGIASKNQNLQDWLSQQWVILFGKKIDELGYEWLLGPFGSTKGIGLRFIKDLAEKEHLNIGEKIKDKGLIQSIHQLNLTKDELNLLPQNIIDFYQNTSNYDLELKVKWNPFFKIFGILLRVIFSKRIEQLNVPIQNVADAKELTSEIIQLLDPVTNEVKRTIWLRTFTSTAQVVYSGVYETCIIPSGKHCIKAVFPLPNGNATVILTPRVSVKGALILESSGKKIGDSGFYFLLKDSKGQLWTKFIRSFKDNLVVRSEDKRIIAIQRLTLWGLSVLQFEYKIKMKVEHL